MKLGVITLQDAPWPELVGALAHLDELGVETIWVADHLGGKWLQPRRAVVRGVELPDRARVRDDSAAHRAARQPDDVPQPGRARADRR